MKQIILVICLAALTACAGTVQTNTARALITIHDTVKISAEAASTLCDQKVIPAEPCHQMKLGYDAFRVEWPQTNSAMQTYLQSPTTTSQEAFAAHYTVFMGLYQQLYAALLTNQVIKLTEGAK